MKMSLMSLAILALLLAPLARAEEMKIGFVDMNKAIQTVDAGKNAKAQLEKEFNAKKKEIESEEASLKKMHEEFKKQSLAMNDDARGKKQAELQERFMKLQEKTARSQMEIQKKEQELTKPIVVKIKSIVSDLAKQKGYNTILEKNENTVLFSLEKDDITNEVISQFNKNKS